MSGSRLEGDFGDFGHPEIRISLPNAHAALPASPLPPLRLDHGAMVPLFFLQEAGWNGPTLVLSLPYPASPEECVRMGEAIAATARASGKRWALLASGDMSHRLQPGAPAGFDPRAAGFDGYVREAVAAGDLRRAIAADRGLRELAAEDVVDSLAVAAGATGFDSSGCETLSYEAPYGVGYLVAVLRDPTGDVIDWPRLLRVARESIQAHLEGRSFQPGPAQAFEPPASGVFVTLWDPAKGEDRGLRGCIGHLERVHPTLSGEIAECAVSAATRDPRFRPVSAAELAGLRIELSLLGAAERVGDAAQLDPATYGVIMVSPESGRQATLLPGIEGVDTVDQQLAIVRRKAGIAPGEPVELYRYTVRKVKE
jgi:AmmeMemoRadiSam system protein A